MIEQQLFRFIGEEAMTHTPHVLNRVAAGDRVRFVTDFYGVQYVELVPRWQFWRKKRIRLDAREAEALKAKLKVRPT